MKRIILIILMISMLMIGWSRVEAVDTQSEQYTNGCNAVTIPTKINYILPDTGMMVDHPLYFFKQLRDQILETLIRNPVKKVEFEILQADKFLSMAQKLSSDPQKQPYLSDSLDRSYVFSQKAFQQIVDIKKKDSNCPPHLKENLVKSIINHREVVAGLEQNQNLNNLSGVFAADDIRFEKMLVQVQQI